MTDLNPAQFKQGELFSASHAEALTTMAQSEGTQNRAAYHLQRADNTPLHDRATMATGRHAADGGHAVARVQVPGPNGPSEKVVALPERTNYAHSQGQLVMGAHDLSQTHELDHHGNVYVGKYAQDNGDSVSLGKQKSHVGDQDWFDKHGPYNSDQHEAFWANHAKVQDMRTSAVLHTGQHSSHTYNHGYIAGPMDAEQPVAHVVRQGGVSYIADGHHRLAEARGRGAANVKVRVLDMDNLNASLPNMAKPKVKKSGSDMRAHLEAEHAVHPNLMNDVPEMYGTANVAARHDVLHRKEFADHVHDANRPVPGKIPTGHFEF